ncbi:hypothetical protein [Streptomyces sp. BH055]|uniref:hypothetical protein n=1 Tax=Streptomyces sp. BH055 TaxID=3401173 RepID=UPI003BB80264
MPTVELTTPDGTVTVDATEPAPGLRLFELPGAPADTPRWVLAHHEGRPLGIFLTAEAANGAAAIVAPMADWTRGVMTAANEISLGGNAERFGLAMAMHGADQHSN